MTSPASPVPAVGKPAVQGRWQQFDPLWYRLRYPDLPGLMQEAGYSGDDPETLERFYREVGAGYGHSPNRYFDELWYRETYPDVRKGVIAGKWASGFAHYCAEGAQDRSPHWLFDENFYRRGNPDLTFSVLQDGGYVNGYAHYLETGESQGRAPSPLVDLRCLARMAGRYPEWFGPEGLFASWLVLPAQIADAERLSWYFDPAWYLQRYPQVQRALAEGRVTSALHHYLTNETPRLFDPSPLFSESWYVSHAPDLQSAIQSGAFRNGFDHFVRFGAREGRQPAEGIDLQAYGANPLVQAQCVSGRWPSPFARLAAERSGHASPCGTSGSITTDLVTAELADMKASESGPAIDENASRRLFQERAALQVPLTAREKLDFSFHGLPEISVIMVVHDKLELTLQTLASLRANYSGALELIVVDSGSRDETRQIECVLKGARILRYPWNIGYLQGCNEALAQARAPVTLYLNNDVRLFPGALENALERLRRAPATGGVVAKLVRSNMRLQEAGSIIWRDGATYGYRREDDPNLPEANFARRVDFGSAAFLLARTGLLKRAGGYDRQFRPAYFEDTDLCLRLQALGADIVYEPLCQVEHLEFGTSGTGGSQAQIQRNFRKFARQHAAFLRGQQPPHVRNAVLGRERGGKGRRLLFIEDRIPLPSQGSGYVRSHELICALARLGWHVTVFPMQRPREPFWRYYGAFPENVELALEQDVGTFPEFLAERAAYYDVLWVGRTHNLRALQPLLNEYSRFLPGCMTILDTEVVAAPRSVLQERLLQEKKAGGQALSLYRGAADDTGGTASDLEERVREELACAQYCQKIIAVTQADAELIRQAGHEDVAVLGHGMALRPTAASYGARRDLLFVGAIHSEDSPNYDSLLWFAREVMPALSGEAAKARLLVAGYVAPGVDLSPLAQLPAVELLGEQEDLTPLYERARVFVAPTRFAGGLPYKVHEAASRGVPMVVTDLLRRQVGWEDGKELLSAPSDDPTAFARAVSQLYENGTLWQRLRQESLAAVERDAGLEIFQQKLAELLGEMVTADRRDAA
ncbi:glycosyltransferase [Oecophyllibacter saccharovorans]|uniref:glycosyltransferase n=1 Tax=Oecophyllibacter saccharovorans TaxID=2558360 RepID=UPI001143D45B|nr:glycosyltransferase [Oecophyllibacter saccharovorans]QDH15347.1 glycosyltransferase [Oecophyllibacter saccharovorans]